MAYLKATMNKIFYYIFIIPPTFWQVRQSELVVLLRCGRPDEPAQFPLAHHTVLQYVHLQETALLLLNGYLQYRQFDIIFILDKE